MRFTLLSFIVLLFAHECYSQDIAIGEWKTHLSYNNAKLLTQSENRVYCAADRGLFYVNKVDNSVEVLSTVQGFSGTIASLLEFDPVTGYLIIGYEDGTLDLVKSGTIKAVTDIRREQIVGEKRLYNADFLDNKIYISTSFGIVIYDLSISEFGDTYRNIGQGGKTVKVRDLTFYKDSIFAATENGLLSASLNHPNLLDHEAWAMVITGDIKSVSNFENNLLVVNGNDLQVKRESGWEVLNDSAGVGFSSVNSGNGFFLITNADGVFKYNKDLVPEFLPNKTANDALVSSDGEVWMALDIYSLIKETGTGTKFLAPNGPVSSDAFRMNYRDGKMLVAGGAYQKNLNAFYSSAGFYVYNDNFWKSHPPFRIKGMESARDFVDVSIEPSTGNFLVASYNKGLFTLKDNEVVQHFTPENSSLQYVAALPGDKIMRIPDFNYDREGNLWVTNNGAPKALSVRTRDDKWHSFNIGTVHPANFVIDSYGQIWIKIGENDGLMVFNPNGTPLKESDDQFRKLGMGEGQGLLPSLTIKSLAVDNNGELWIGSSDGVAVIFDPSAVFDGRKFDARQVYVNDPQNPGYLLAGQTVTAIEVDGGNRKWFGTSNGVWLTNEDGDEILAHFTTDNSPLLSNEILDIEINGETGEVFFATDIGIISFRSTATNPTPGQENAYVFPNPIRPGYSGPIAIKGLLANSIVKITDINGNIVSELKSEGGQAVWDGRNLNGRAVRSGVYVVYSSNDYGTETIITKILVIR